MEVLNLEATLRPETGKNKVKQLTKTGLIPANISGGKSDPIAVSIDPQQLEKLYKSKFGSNTIIKIAIKNGEKTEKEETVLSHEISRHIIRQNLTHISFLRVEDKKLVNIKIPVKLKGIAPGVKLGGSLYHKNRWIKISCTPDNIPECLEIDISELNIGDSVKIQDIAENNKYTILTTPLEIVVQVAAQRGKTIEEEEEEAAAAGAEGEGTDADAEANKGSE
jgi:large subunit ribosomal protein L25